MDRLLREGNPPAGQLASPKPQYKDVQTNNWEELKGEGGASYVKDKDVFAKLEQARALLDAIKVQASGHIREFAVASWDDLPPDSVPVGSVAMLIGTNDIRQTDGEEWLPI